MKVVVGSKLGVEIQIKSGHLPWAKKDQNIKEIDIKKPFNEYWASNVHELTVPGRLSSPSVRSYLIEKRRGGCRWKVSVLYRITFLREPYGSCLYNYPSHLATNVRIGGVSTLVAQKTQGIAKGTFPDDGRTDGEGCGQGY